MAIELEVKINMDINLESLRTESMLMVKKILKIVEAPSIYFYKNKKELNDQDLKKNLLDTENFQIALSSSPARIDLLVVNLDHLLPYIHQDEAGDWAIVSVLSRNLEDYVLVAAVAIVLARFNKSSIIDESNVWFENRETDWGIAENKLSLKCKQESLEKAINVFNIKLNQ